MIISNKSVQRVEQIYGEQKRAGKVRRPAKPASFDDEVELSVEGKELQGMLQKLRNVPEIRPVAEDIKAAVKSDTYQVSARQVALGILKSIDKG